MPDIHPTAIVASGAEIADDARIGPYCVVGEKVVMGAGTILHSHVVVAGRTTLDEGVQIFPFASVGMPPQDLKYRGEDSALTIGAGTRVREHVTINPGTEHGGMLTAIGKNCLLMVGAHVAHDCKLGDGVILANNATIAGHVQIGDNAILGGLSAILQFVRIGRNAMIGGMAGVRQDVIPFGLVAGREGRLAGLNMVGLRRLNQGSESVAELRKAYRLLFMGEEGLSESRDKIESAYAQNELVQTLLSFLKTESTHGLMRPEPWDKEQ